MGWYKGANSISSNSSQSERRQSRAVKLTISNQMAHLRLGNDNLRAKLRQWSCR
jgi:hypothetical protein